MLRPRGSPQRTHRDPCFRSHNQDNEGSQGKPDLSTSVYKVGECVQELTKGWKEYEASQADKMSESSSNGPTLDIWIPSEHVSAANRQVRGNQLWGTDIYTDDSDLVAVLMHTGYCHATASQPEATIQELRVAIRVLPPQESCRRTIYLAAKAQYCPRRCSDQKISQMKCMLTMNDLDIDFELEQRRVNF
nr:uncharacterized protein LOC113698963 isoform X2 [Coffea arabica]